MIPQIIDYSPGGERCGACGCRCDGRRLNLTLENRLVCDQCYDRETMTEFRRQPAEPDDPY